MECNQGKAIIDKESPCSAVSTDHQFTQTWHEIVKLMLSEPQN